MKHHSIAALRSIPRTRRILSAVSIVLSLVFALAAFAVPQGTSWTYQGQLQRSGAAYNGTCNFQFVLWNAASDGTQLVTQPINSVNVVNGLFTVVLDFAGGDFFRGDARWLATSVQCSGDGGFTQLNPRQPITATPYALSLRPGATIEGGSLTVSNPNGGAGLIAVSTVGHGVHGTSNFIGVYGQGQTGVTGVTTLAGGTGVSGEALLPNSAGVFGSNRDSAGVWGVSNGNGSAIFGQSSITGFAGRFSGPVLIEGNLFVQGSVSKSGGSFRIDHPLDPANKFLSHSFVESPDMKNIYDGNVTTDATGSATVTLPDYFAALNRECRYQLTVLGQFAQAIVSRKIAGNTFEIRTDKPGVEVSWQVTGIRQDAYAQAHPIAVEEAKPAEEQGLYLFPAGFGAGAEKQIGYPSRPVMPQPEQEITNKTK
jgi:hypothetical protein